MLDSNVTPSALPRTRTEQAAIDHDWQPMGEGGYRLESFAVLILYDGSARTNISARSTRCDDDEGAKFVALRSVDPHVSLRRWVEFDWHDEREGRVLLRAELYRSRVGGVIAVQRQTHVLHTVEWNEERQAFDPASGYHGGQSTGSGEQLSFGQVQSLTQAASDALRQKRDRRGYLEA